VACTLAAGCTKEHHPAPEADTRTAVTISVSAKGQWRVLERDSCVVIALANHQTTVLVDWTDQRSDNRHPGVFLTHKGVSFAGKYGNASAPFFVPDIPETQDSVWVLTTDSSLVLGMQCGTYADIKPSADPQIDALPVVFQAVIAGQTDLTLELSGLYYVLLPVSGTTLRISCIGGSAVDTLRVDRPGTRIIRYYDNVTSIRAWTREYGEWQIETDARRLQVDIPASSAGTNLFELDFDHSYKDRGQRSVRSFVHIQH